MKANQESTKKYSKSVHLDLKCYLSLVLRLPVDQHVMRHSQQAIESDSSYVLASLKCLYYVVHVFLILNIHNIHYHGVDLR